MKLRGQTALEYLLILAGSIMIVIVTSSVLNGVMAPGMEIVGNNSTPLLWPPSGECGLAATVYGSSATGYSGAFCAVGTPNPTPVFPPQGSSVTWFCNVTDGGYNASCSASRAATSTPTPTPTPLPVNGACGISSAYALTATTSGLCSSGTVYSFAGTGPWTWFCNGTNGGTDASCTATVIVDGTCGTSNGANLTAAPTTNLCSNGTNSSVSGTGPWTWFCNGTNGGTNASCWANVIINNGGACGTAAKRYAYNVTSYGTDTICNAGIASPSSPAFPTQGASVSWRCIEVNLPEITINVCTASRAAAPVNGACGTASKTYVYTATSYGTDTFCANGTASPASPAFPAQGQTIPWTCVGTNNGTNASCSATRPAKINGECITSAYFSNLNVFSCGYSEMHDKIGSPVLSWCVAGSMTSYTGGYTGPWTWKCLGAYGGTNASCSASHTSEYHPSFTCGYSGRTTAACVAAGGYVDWSVCDGCGFCKSYSAARGSGYCDFLTIANVPAIPYGYFDNGVYWGCI